MPVLSLSFNKILHRCSLFYLQRFLQNQVVWKEKFHNRFNLFLVPLFAGFDGIFQRCSGFWLELMLLREFEAFRPITRYPYCAMALSSHFQIFITTRTLFKQQNSHFRNFITDGSTLVVVKGLFSDEILLKTLVYDSSFY